MTYNHHLGSIFFVSDNGVHVTVHVLLLQDNGIHLFPWIAWLGTAFQMIAANGNGNQGCLGNWFNPHYHRNSTVLFQVVIFINLANMLVVGSMVGLYKLGTTFSMFSVGMAMLGIPMLPWI